MVFLKGIGSASGDVGAVWVRGNGSLSRALSTCHNSSKPMSAGMV